jgi:hypothetical protein
MIRHSKLVLLSGLSSCSTHARVVKMVETTASAAYRRPCREDAPALPASDLGGVLPSRAEGLRTPVGDVRDVQRLLSSRPATVSRASWARTTRLGREDTMARFVRSAGPWRGRHPRLQATKVR